MYHGPVIVYYKTHAIKSVRANHPIKKNQRNCYELYIMHVN